MMKRPVPKEASPVLVPRQKFVTGTATGTPEGAEAGTPPRTLPVLIQHEEDPMNRTLAALDREWGELNNSPTTAQALERWGRSEPALAGLPTLAAILEQRRSPVAAPTILAALARLAVDDELAARCLLQALVPGLVRMASTAFADDPLALDEMVSLAWERIRTYPTSRPGSVAANVLWDVRKRYREHRVIEGPGSLAEEPTREEPTPSAEDIVMERSAVDDLVVAHRDGVISGAALVLILRTRIDEVSLDTAAREQHATVQQANCIRWRAERRLRPVLRTAC
ncbi:MAG: hypothetical protein KY447_05795 [Actinobacteria bacterium]|nr:hypothetical protein [Actinomycetota bacterium]